MSLLYQLLTWNQSQVSVHSAGNPSVVSRCCHLQRSVCPYPWCWAVQSCSPPAALQCTAARPARPAATLNRELEQAEGRGGSIFLGRNKRDPATPFCIGLQPDQFIQTLKSHLQTSIIQFCFCVTHVSCRYNKLPFACLCLSFLITSSLSTSGLCYKLKHG